MNSNDLPFEIGKDYENWEFDLEPMSIERIPVHDSYLYTGDVKKFLNFFPQKTELIFHWDILEIVILTFIHTGNSSFHNFIKKPETPQNISNSLLDFTCCYFKYKNNQLKYCLIYQVPNKTVLIYGKPHLVHQVSLMILEEIKY